MPDTGLGSLDARTRAFTIAHRVLRFHVEHGGIDSSVSDLLIREVLPAIEDVGRGIPLVARSDQSLSADDAWLIGAAGVSGDLRFIGPHHLSLATSG